MVKSKKCRVSLKNKNELCSIHDPEKNTCVSCRNIVVDLNKKIKLSNCGHIFCKLCLSDHVLTHQWFENFSTENPLKCPCCETNLCDYNWSAIMNYLVSVGSLQRAVVYSYYLNDYWVGELNRLVKLGKMYTVRERHIIEDYWNFHNDTHLWNLIFPDEVPDIVFFFKIDYLDDSTFLRKNFYRFMIDYNFIKNKNNNLHKELIEFMFHPDRVRRLGGLDYIEQLE